MNKFFVIIPLVLIMTPVAAMPIEADPRSIISFMDKSLQPEFDILRVTTDITEDNHLVFQVQTKGERTSGEGGDYVLLNILHEKMYILIIPLNRETGESIRIFEGELQPENQLTSITFKESQINKQYAGFNAKHVARGTEFIMPLDWINFGADFGFDAYTIRANIQDETLHISEVYDQARRGRNQEKRMSAITLLNNICSPKK